MGFQGVTHDDAWCVLFKLLWCFLNVGVLCLSKRRLSVFVALVSDGNGTCPREVGIHGLFSLLFVAVGVLVFCFDVSGEHSPPPPR